MKKIYPYLSYAGALPFIFCSGCFILNIHTLPLLGDTDKVLSVYGLVITSFMAGSHWGQHLSLSGKWVIYLPTLSNINAIFLWFSFIIFPFKMLLFVFVISFFLLLSIDRVLFLACLISRKYFRTRCLVTLLVVSSLIFSGIYA